MKENSIRLKRGTIRFALMMVLTTLGFSPLVGATDLIVVALTPGSEADRAGLETGDILTHWRESTVRQSGDMPWIAFDGPFHLRTIELGLRPDAIVTTLGSRGGANKEWQLRAGDWGLQLRPYVDQFDDNRLLCVCEHGADYSDLPIVALRNLRSELAIEDNHAAVGWLAGCIAAVAAYRQTHDDGLTSLSATPLQRLNAFYYLLRASLGETALDDLLPAIRQSSPNWDGNELNSVQKNVGRFELAKFEVSRGELDTASALLEPLVAELRVTNSGAPLQAISVELYADTLRMRGELEPARAAYLQAQALMDTLPGSTIRLEGQISKDLGTVAAIGGDLDLAEQLYDQALQLIESTDGEAGTAPVLNNLGIVNSRRGDMRRAEFYYQRAMAINERNGAWIGYNRNLFNLADIAYARGDYQTSETLHQKLKLSFQRLSPNSPDLALTTLTLAHSQFEQKKYDIAETNYIEAIALFSKVAPESPDLSGAFLGLGDIAFERGDLQVAIGQFQKALAMRMRIAPAGSSTAEAHNFVAKALAATGQRARAHDHLLAALAIFEAIAPGSIAHAETYYELAKEDLAGSDHDSALTHFEMAVSALEEQTRRLGGADDSRAQFSRRYGKYFKEYLELLHATGNSEKAFDVLERYRARSLLGMLMERESSLSMSLPPSVAEERKSREKEYNAARSALVDLSNIAADQESIGTARNRVLEAQVKRDGFARRLQSIAGSYAKLRYPLPLDTEGAQQSLEPGTLAIAYSVGREKTLAFAMSPTTLKTYVIDISADDLQANIKRLNYLIDAGRIDRRPSQAFVDLASELYQQLVAPIDGVKNASYLLILPDGPLHFLPFGALVTAQSDAVTPRPNYLIEKLPIHQALSLTLYRELKTRHDSSMSLESVAVFADPSFAAPADKQDEVRSSLYESAEQLPPLAWSRNEASILEYVFASSVDIYVGADATEQAFRRAAREADILHVASHAIANQSAPLDSAIVFSPGDASVPEADGLLHTWEIFEDVQLQSSLVVLSACQSGWGREAAGEGLLGLQRAFHYAGARSVLASLWKVNDRSTSRLMEVFYQQLATGVALDEAFRKAQLALIESANTDNKSIVDRFLNWASNVEDYAHPYHWAGFHISGSVR